MEYVSNNSERTLIIDVSSDRDILSTLQNVLRKMYDD